MSTPRRTAARSRLPARGAISGGRERRRAQFIVSVEVIEVVGEISDIGDVRGLVLVGRRAASGW
eukprot:165755-Rhodomonas_salina.1